MNLEFGKNLPEEKRANREIIKEDQEQEFYSMIGNIDAAARETKGLQAIVKKAEEDGDFLYAIDALTAFLDKRNQTLDRAEISINNPDIRLHQEGVDQIIHDIKHTISNPDAFLGNGSVAEVYILPTKGSRLCIKWIKDYQRYAEGVHIEKELSFLDELRDLEVDGVRAPMPFFSFSTIRMKGIVMEHLNAVNFRRVIEGQTTEGIQDVLPSGFDINKFFSSLENYVRKMHQMGIYHGDLHLRNMMIDRETSTPYIIDFGKGAFERELDKSSKYQKDLAANDLEALRLAKIEAMQWIQKNKAKAA